MTYWIYPLVSSIDRTQQAIEDILSLLVSKDDAHVAAHSWLTGRMLRPLCPAPGCGMHGLAVHVSHDAVRTWRCANRHSWPWG